MSGTAQQAEADWPRKMYAVDLDALRTLADAVCELALSIRQPWATLIMKAGKDIENRCWPTRVRGRVLIHAAKGCTRDELDDALDFAEKVCGIRYSVKPATISRGGIVGSVEIVDCVSKSASPWFVGEYGFVLRDPQPLPFVPWKGQLGFFDIPDAALSSNIDS